MVKNPLIEIQIVYASSTQQETLTLKVEKGITIKEAIHQSKMCLRFPEIDLEKNKVGVFNKIKNLDDVLNEGDRVEIYRELIINPKEARRLRFTKQQINKKKSQTNGS